MVQRENLRATSRFVSRQLASHLLCAENHGSQQKDSEYTYAWTAVSRPPYLTALALWPKGNCWWGGGLFQDNYTLLLNHRSHEAVPHPGHVPTRIRVVPNPEAAGEDDPLYSDRLERDGWRLQQEW